MIVWCRRRGFVRFTHSSESFGGYGVTGLQGDTLQACYQINALAAGKNCNTKPPMISHSPSLNFHRERIDAR